MIPWINYPRTYPPVAPAEDLVYRTPHTSLYDDVTANYTVSINDVVLLANGSLTILLPLDHPRLGHKIVIKNIGTANVTLTTI